MTINRCSAGSNLTRLVVVVALGALAVCSWHRSAVWVSEHTVWTDAVRVAPLSARVHANLAFDAQARGDFEVALPEIQRVIALACDPLLSALTQPLSSNLRQRVQKGIPSCQ